MSSSMVAPALNDIVRDLRIPNSDSFEKQLVLSIFVLFYGVAPVLAGPLSKQYGRSTRSTVLVGTASHLDAESQGIKEECQCYSSAT